MTRTAFVTVTDAKSFPGTLAAVNSILLFHPDADVYVISNQNLPLTSAQVRCLQGVEQVKLLGSEVLDRPERRIGTLELKAYACHDLCADYDVMVGMDSDCVLCSSVADMIEDCHDGGGFIVGDDGSFLYGDEYAAYGFPVPAVNARCMSAAIHFCAVTPSNREVLTRWAAGCSRASSNFTGPYQGHRDQGVLNAVLFALGRTKDIRLLEERLWSQRETYWNSIIHFRDGAFFNVSALGRKQRVFHCGGQGRFWLPEHRDRVLAGHELQGYGYIWFLAMMWFGRCGDWQADPQLYLPQGSQHLLGDLIQFLPQIFQVYPPSRERWNSLSDAMMDRALGDIPRALPLNGGSMSEVIELVDRHRGMRYVEIGGYEGGSIITLALRFMNRDVDFYCIESFMGNFSGTVDGSPLPSRRKFWENLARFPSLRIHLVPGDSALAGALFEDRSLDFVFIDGCHATPSVLRDIDMWLPKVRPGGIVAGDDYGWESVRAAVDERFPEARRTRSGWVWWTKVP